MGLLDRAKADFTRFTQLNSGAGVELIFSPPTGDPVTVKGFATKHHLQIDPETGLPISSKNTHCCISESILVDAGYTVRNSDDEVSLINHLVTYTDSAGVERTYKIIETMPDETIGQITCYLGDYE